MRVTYYSPFRALISAESSLTAFIKYQVKLSAFNVLTP